MCRLGVVVANGARSSRHAHPLRAHLPAPFLSIPGNHDGDTTDDTTRAPLDTWMANFYAAKPALPPGNEEYGRDVQTQPYCDWTLQCEAVTIVGLYSNVPSGGHLEQSQIDWLTGELKDADRRSAASTSA